MASKALQLAWRQLMEFVSQLNYELLEARHLMS